MRMPGFSATAGLQSVVVYDRPGSGATVPTPGTDIAGDCEWRQVCIPLLSYSDITERFFISGYVCGLYVACPPDMD
jgi:hypothetical protein